AYTDPEPSGATYYYRVRYVNFAGQFGAYSPVVSSNGVNVGSIGTNASNALADAAAAQADADAANAALDDIASDNILSPVEKPVVVRDTNVIVAEQPGIDAQATAYGITTQATAYDTAVSALTSYLATLTAPVLWSDLTGNTTIVGATFRSKFADAYTTRQALLNAIYAAAKAKADAAQDTANTAVGQVTQLPVINGGFDIAPTGYGWVADSGSGWTIDTAGNTPGIGPNSAAHPGGSGGTQVFRNNGLAACQPGQVYKTQALIKAVGANGSCYVAISWCDAAGAEITTTAGNAATGTGTTGSYAVDPAPAGTVYARTLLVANGHTSGTYYADNVVCTQYPSSVGEVPDGGGRYAVHAIDGNNLALVDFSQSGHVNKQLDNIADGSTFIRSMQPSGVGTGFDIDNAMFQIPVDASGIPGWVPNGTANIFYQSSAPTPIYGAQYLTLYTGASGYSYAQSRKSFKVKAGDNISIAAEIYAASSAFTLANVAFYTSAGAYISAISAASSSASWQGVVASGPVPATADHAYITLQCANANAYALFNAIVVTVNDVRVAGSGARLGDMRNQVMVGVGNYGAGWSGGSITYSATTTSATITAAAATLQLGSSSLAYNSANVTVSGSAGLVRTYYLYYDDDGYTGGSKTLNATTSQITSLAANGRILVGQVTVTFPTSGTGGGGGNTGCPVREAWVMRRDLNGEREMVRAGSIVVGDDLALERGGWGRVTYSAPKLVPCVRVTVNNHDPFSLSCSRTAPLGLCSGGSVLAPDSLGEGVRVLHPVPALGATVTAVDDIGMRWVQHITCEDDFFWAGDNPKCLFSHHNLKPP
ncbi:hypothetical protein HFP05_06000, partial [Rhodanobacter denitrificans]|nr:hypothetical protein [Rhodanobacter denitrificans]